MNKNLIRASLTSAALLVSGCSTTLVVEPYSSDLPERFESAKFLLVVNDKSLGAADNIDGALNKLWTSDGAVRVTVKNNLRTLREMLEDSGFSFVETAAECNVTAELSIKSVRYDPVGGWITDDMRMDYVSRPDGVLLGTVFAKEQFVTPKIEDAIWTIYEGSVQLWGAE